jgi:lysophospholipid acyltransferase (LPLAT)-like uncharacterized protein
MSKQKRAAARSTDTSEGEPKLQGSAYDAATSRRPARKFSRRIKSWFSGRAVAVVALVFPRLYLAYCWFVWRTSRVEDVLTGPLNRTADRHGGFVAALWHEEVFSVAYAYRHMGGHTVASTGNFGLIITRLLELCNFTVFRGGASRGSARKRRVLNDMIHNFRTEPRVPYGITVDGSRGPAYHMKPGSVVIARSCRAPLMVGRVWYSNYVRLSTWDRTVIPLPFGRIKVVAVGPYWVRPDGGKAELEGAVEHLQSELRDLAHHTIHEIEGRSFGDAPEGFPEGWTPRWQPGQPLGLKRTPWDLEPDNPPPWACAYGDKSGTDEN